MREVDRRSKYNRRIFLQGAATTVPTVAVAASAGLGISDAWADDAIALTPATLKTLVKVARDIYPHDFLGDSFSRSNLTCSASTSSTITARWPYPSPSE